MIWTKKTIDPTTWRPWFAWYPVMVDEVSSLGYTKTTTAWWETVERAQHGPSSFAWRYRMAHDRQV